MAITDVINQVKENCPCFEDNTESDLDNMVTRLVDLLSTTLCWANNLCETFLNSDREETRRWVKTNCFTCQPCDRYKSIDLFYVLPELEVEITSVELVTYNGLIENHEVISKENYVYRKGNLIIDTSILPNTCCTCSCEDHEIIIKYKSGFEELPDCLLPVFCDLLTNMSLSLTGCGSIDDCCSMTRPKAYSYLKSKKIGDISYAWDVDSSHITYIYEKMLQSSQLKMINMLSLCNYKQNNRLWVIKSC